MTVPEPQLILSEEQKRSPLWILLSDHWNKKLASYQLLNERDESEIVTSKLRGKIAEIRANLYLARDIQKMD